MLSQHLPCLDLLFCTGMEIRKKWKDSIKCVQTHQTIWEHLKTEARTGDTDLINRHVWVQWPLEEEGPTMFLGKITEVTPWDAECTIVYYYRYHQLPLSRWHDV